MELKEIYIKMAILGVIIFGLMSFIFVAQADNEVQDGLASNPLMNQTYGDLYSNLSNSQDRSQLTSDNFDNITPQTIFVDVQVQSIFSTTSLLKTIPSGLWNIYIVLPMSVLGVSPVIASVISSILILLLIIGAWALWKGVIKV